MMDHNHAVVVDDGVGREFYDSHGICELGGTYFLQKVNEESLGAERALAEISEQFEFVETVLADHFRQVVRFMHLNKELHLQCNRDKE